MSSIRINIISQNPGLSCRIAKEQQGSAELVVALATPLTSTFGRGEPMPCQEKGHTEPSVCAKNRGSSRACLTCKGVIPGQPRLPQFRALKCCHNKAAILSQPSQTSKDKEKWNYGVAVILFQLMISYNGLFVTKLISSSWTLLSCGIRINFWNRKEHVPVCFIWISLLMCW